MVEFNKAYWLDQLTKEVGLDGVPYEELSKHYVNFDSVIGTEGENEASRKNAKQYVDEQLAYIEEQYKLLNESNIEVPQEHEVPVFDPSDVLSKLLVVSESAELNQVEDNIYKDLDLGAFQLKEVKQEVLASNMKYFDVVIGESAYTVVINDHGGDFRIKDQINHVINTTFFVEIRNPMELTGFEQIISYYQFVNAIQPHLKPSTDLTAFDKISKGLETAFDGVKLEGFND